MRQIRFRAWDVGYKHWINRFSLDSDGSTLLYADIGYRVPKEAILVQFTGLLDKNGKEIYEGDILKHDLWGKTEVIWDNESACFRGKNNEKKHDITLAHHQLNRSRIIGNIYENLELLRNA